MILDDICDRKRIELAERKAQVPLGELEAEIAGLDAPRDIRKALRGPHIRLIAEVKRASPSRGDFPMPVGSPAELAAVYEAAGAHAISVLTETQYFKGSLEDLRAVRRKVALPCLRKDFIVDEYQIYEARAAQADAVLLIVRALSNEQLTDYLGLARKLGLGALVETHTADEIARAIEAGAPIIGINNRDLSSFTVSLDTTLELRKVVPGGHVLVSESGISTRDDVRRLEEAGVDAILVGEALVTSGNVREKVRELLGSNAGES